MGQPITTMPEQLYRMVAPDGRDVRIDVQVFRALLYFLDGQKRSGSVEIEFSKGGIAGVVKRERLK